MSEEIRNEDEVEGHGHHITPVFNANDEQGDEVEGHGHHITPVFNANDEQADEADSDDEVEAHRNHVHNRPGYTN